MHYKSIAKLYSFLLFTQLLSFSSNVIMFLTLPKKLNVSNFGYWQLFLLYTSYVGFFHFGLNDGIHLRYGGKNYNLVQKGLLKGQFLLLLLIQLLIVLIVIIYIYNDNLWSADKHFIIFFCLIFMVISNLTSFITSLLQSCNRIKEFSNTIIISTVTLLVGMIVLFYFKIYNYRYYIFVYVIAYLFSFIYALIITKDLILSKIRNIKKDIFVKEFWNNISCGFLLMLSIIFSILTIGFGRFLIENLWGIKIFSKVSLALTVIMFFIFFIRQISVIIFPLLKNTNFETQRKSLKLSIVIMDFLLLLIPLFYPLVSIFINYWLPNYSDTLIYVVLLIPVCIYDGKMQVLYLTYLKVLRKEKFLFFVNFISFLSCLVICFFGYYCNSIKIIVFSMSFSLILRGVIIEYFLQNYFKLNSIKNIILFTLMIFIFLQLFITFHYEMSSLIYLLFFMFYIFLTRKSLLEAYFSIKKLYLNNK